MKGLIFTISFLFLTLGDTGLAANPTTPLYRYWQASVSDHFYTIDPNEIGTTIPGGVGKDDYTSQGIQCLIYRYQVQNSVPLYRCWQSSVSDHFYTTNADEITTTTPGQTGKYELVSQGIAGYCMAQQTPDTIPLYRSCTCAIALFPGSPSFRAISTGMTFEVIRVLIARKEGEPGDEATCATLTTLTLTFTVMYM